MSAPIEPNPRVTFKVRYEDEDLVVVEKPARVVTQPGVGHEHDTLLNGLVARYGERLERLGRARDHGLVHRLDKDTSGLVVVALSARGYDGVRAQFEERRVRKFYWAVTHKAPREAEGVIRKPIEEVVERATRYTSLRRARVSERGHAAVTAYRTLDASDLAALVEARPVTGRLHQVRVHLDLIGCAILGDELYGPGRVRHASARLALHAHRIALDHPVTGSPIDVCTAWPTDLRGLVRSLGLRRPVVDGRPSEAGDELGGDAVGDEEPGVGEAPEIG